MTTDDIRRWLEGAIDPLTSSGRDAVSACLELGEKLEDTLRHAGYRIVLDLWISSRFEEAEVVVQKNGDAAETISLCFIPMQWKSIRL